MTKSGKHCGKRRNCSFWAISSFVTMFSKSCLLQKRQKASIWGKGLTIFPHRQIWKRRLKICSCATTCRKYSAADCSFLKHCVKRRNCSFLGNISFYHNIYLPDMIFVSCGLNTLQEKLYHFKTYILYGIENIWERV